MTPELILFLLERSPHGYGLLVFMLPFEEFRVWQPIRDAMAVMRNGMAPGMDLDEFMMHAYGARLHHLSPWKN